MRTRQKRDGNGHVQKLKNLLALASALVGTAMPALANGVTERASVSTTRRSEGNAASFVGSISADGHFVAFNSASSNLVGAATQRIYRRLRPRSADGRYPAGQLDREREAGQRQQLHPVHLGRRPLRGLHFFRHEPGHTRHQRARLQRHLRSRPGDGPPSSGSATARQATRRTALARGRASRRTGASSHSSFSPRIWWLVPRSFGPRRSTCVTANLARLRSSVWACATSPVTASALRQRSRQVGVIWLSSPRRPTWCPMIRTGSGMCSSPTWSAIELTASVSGDAARQRG